MRRPERTNFIVTPAIRRALVAINDQKVFRIYGQNGSIWKCERGGVSPRTLWKLLAAHLLEDEPGTIEDAELLTKVRMRLSNMGLEFLRANLATR